MRILKSRVFRTVAAAVILFAALSGTAGVAARKTEAACAHEPKNVAQRLVLPTCTKDGWGEYQCRLCGRPFRKIYPATGHSLKRESLVTSATCTTDGLEYCKCSTCGYTCYRKIPKLGHNYVKTTENGQTVYKCRRCGITRI